MINVNYQKRKNLELFKCLEKSETLFLSNVQNYIPIYNKFFTLNDSNYNSINLNNKWYISNVKKDLQTDYRYKFRLTAEELRASRSHSYNEIYIQMVKSFSNDFEKWAI